MNRPSGSHIRVIVVLNFFIKVQEERIRVHEELAYYNIFSKRVYFDILFYFLVSFFFILLILFILASICHYLFFNVVIIEQFDLNMNQS